MRIRVGVPVVSAMFFSLFLFSTAACASTRGRVYLRVGPPAPIAEARVVAPGPRYVWIAGYQRWNGRSYNWVPGRWAVPPRPHAVWVPGRYVHERRGYYFVEGHWRR